MTVTANSSLLDTIQRDYRIMDQHLKMASARIAAKFGEAYGLVHLGADGVALSRDDGDVSHPRGNSLDVILKMKKADFVAWFDEGRF